jgi:hypothetical protein
VFAVVIGVQALREWNTAAGRVDVAAGAVLLLLLLLLLLIILFPRGLILLQNIMRMVMGQLQQVGQVIESVASSMHVCLHGKYH